MPSRDFDKADQITKANDFLQKASIYKADKAKTTEQLQEDLQGLLHIMQGIIYLYPDSCESSKIVERLIGATITAYLSQDVFLDHTKNPQLASLWYDIIMRYIVIIENILKQDPQSILSVFPILIFNAVGENKKRIYSLLLDLPQKIGEKEITPRPILRLNGLLLQWHQAVLTQYANSPQLLQSLRLMICQFLVTEHQDEEQSSAVSVPVSYMREFIEKSQFAEEKAYLGVIAEFFAMIEKLVKKPEYNAIIAQRYLNELTEISQKLQLPYEFVSCKSEIIADIQLLKQSIETQEQTLIFTMRKEIRTLISTAKQNPDFDVWNKRASTCIKSWQSLFENHSSAQLVSLLKELITLSDEKSFYQLILASPQIDREPRPASDFVEFIKAIHNYVAQSMPADSEELFTFRKQFAELIADCRVVEDYIANFTQSDPASKECLQIIFDLIVELATKPKRDFRIDDCYCQMLHQLQMQWKFSPTLQQSEARPILLKLISDTKGKMHDTVGNITKELKAQVALDAYLKTELEQDNLGKGPT